jgi:hypothetical protein
MRFRAKVELSGRTATGVEVPENIVAGLGPSRRPPVRVTIGGHTYRSTVAAMHGRFMLPISADNRRSAGVTAGDDIDIEVEPDHEPREVTVPADLGRALAHDADAARGFERLSYSHKRAYVQWIEGAKKAETRSGRVTRAAAMLRQGRAQP